MATEISSFLKSQNIAHQEARHGNELLDRVTEYLMSGKVVGWFQGRFEWGPRALGNPQHSRGSTRCVHERYRERENQIP